ncbi:hypothetical protein GCM10018980_35060 [Streptomyces capoamus]|uniref:Uncharacterized protein n=1 Tax=Streptomyces capoamus TaxID=68183 RepID=A0A919C6Z8_9ACTN|nr:hypothetical protein GCM10018980_35060 [Streptomyces capoamus]
MGDAVSAERLPCAGGGASLVLTMRTLMPLASGYRWNSSQWSGGRQAVKATGTRLITEAR